MTGGVTRPTPRLLVLPELGRWASQWDELVDLSPLPSPFVRSWWLTGTVGPPVLLSPARTGWTPLGGLALEEGRRLGAPPFRMMGAGPLCPGHLDLLAAPGQQDAVVRAVGAWLCRRGARLLDLEGLRGGTRLMAALPGHVRQQPDAAPWTLLPADAKSYLAARPDSAGRSAAPRAAWQRKGRSFAPTEASRRCGPSRPSGSFTAPSREPAPGFCPASTASRLPAALRRSSMRWRCMSSWRPKPPPRLLSPSRSRGEWSLYQNARLTDFRWRDATPVLLTAIITDACSRGFTEAGFLRGDEAYKSNFAPERRELLWPQAANGRTGQARPFSCWSR
jgi:Acetyltransferase (GNAT) domain